MRDKVLKTWQQMKKDEIEADFERVRSHREEHNKKDAK